MKVGKIFNFIEYNKRYVDTDKISISSVCINGAHRILIEYNLPNEPLSIIVDSVNLLRNSELGLSELSIKEMELFLNDKKGSFVYYKNDKHLNVFSIVKTIDNNVVIKCELSTSGYSYEQKILVPQQDIISINHLTLIK